MTTTEGGRLPCSTASRTLPESTASRFAFPSSIGQHTKKSTGLVLRETFWSGSQDMPVACGLLLSSRPLGTLQWSKGEIRIQSSGSSTQITTTSRCSGEIAEASVSKGITNLELPSIGWQLFILDSSQSDPIALPAFLDTYATRLLTEPLRGGCGSVYIIPKVVTKIRKFLLVTFAVTFRRRSPAMVVR